jgi:hypothetical protein
VDVAKTAYHQVESLEEEEEECGQKAKGGRSSGSEDDDDKDDDDEMANCRDVGHNIYLLAHQVNGQRRACRC